MPPATTVSGWLPMMRLKPSTNVAAFAEIDAVREPDDFDVRRGARKRSISGSASVRSTPYGFGLSCLICTRAAPATCSEISRAVSDSGSTRDAAIVGFGARDQFIGRAQPRVPGGRRAPSRRRA